MNRVALCNRLCCTYGRCGCTCIRSDALSIVFTHMNRVALCNRLLHAGAHARDIVHQYVATIRVLREIDPSGESSPCCCGSKACQEIACGCTHTRTHTHSHTHTHTYTYTHEHSPTLTHTDICTHMNTRPHSHTHIHTHSHTHTHMNTRPHRDICTHT